MKKIIEIEMDEVRFEKTVEAQMHLKIAVQAFIAEVEGNVFPYFAHDEQTSIKVSSPKELTVKARRTRSIVDDLVDDDPERVGQDRYIADLEADDDNT